ncbi:MAG: PAAR domain-containing protein [Deltaproteobacteria bacterium]|nr:PAAR domain-containing protein [Deltaproteobacteria bacterium]
MPPQCRLGDTSMVPADAHGCVACPHPCVGPAIAGSPDVMVNNMPAIRVDDTGIHMACCGPNTWTATKGSSTVFINNKAAHRLGDTDKHCGGSGQMIMGSPTVQSGD